MAEHVVVGLLGCYIVEVGDHPEQFTPVEVRNVERFTAAMAKLREAMADG